MKLVLIGDGESPHLLKWARALAPRVDLWAASSRGFLPAFDSCVLPQRRLALDTRPRFAGGNVSLLRELPRLVAWLKAVSPDWLHAHYLSSHGTLAWLARRLGVDARLCGSAWGSDILVAPQRSVAMRWVTRRVLRACEMTTSDSRHMAQCMRALGARQVDVFPFGLEEMPPEPGPKNDRLFFANRGLEAIYAPHRVIEQFAVVAAAWPTAELVVAHDGSLRGALEQQVRAAGLAERVRFTGRLDALQQAALYRQARWYLSLPASDSVSVSVLEAMAWGCVPVVSDLPANRELVADGRNGLIVPDGGCLDAAAFRAMQERADAAARTNRAWISQQAIFPQAVERFVQRLVQVESEARA